MLSADANRAFDNYSHALGIGNLRYFLVSGKGIVAVVNDDDMVVTLRDDTTTFVRTIATEFIFGNAVRDATGLININEFKNTMDFNNVSAELNRIIREKVLPQFKPVIKKGDAITFTGAIEMNKAHPDLSHIEIVPIDVKIVPR